eukprot:5092755-Amphidinium_carterae.1
MLSLCTRLLIGVSIRFSELGERTPVLGHWHIQVGRFLLSRGQVGTGWNASQDGWVCQVRHDYSSRFGWWKAAYFENMQGADLDEGGQLGQCLWPL